ncbi:MAG: hypothetical protein ACLGHT_09725, partial [Acidimicrobiia bacterium]
VCGICENEFSAALERTPVAANEPAGADRAMGDAGSSFVTRRRAQLVSEAARATPEDRTPERLIARAAATTGADAADVIAATRWYERFGTSDEQPMPAATDAEARRRVHLARALLRADGTLRGPAIDLDGTEVASGDRVIVTADVPSLELAEGTLGTVLEVNDRRADVDFATWGRLRAGIGETVSQFLRHDYVAIAPEREPPSREVDVATPSFER